MLHMPSLNLIIHPAQTVKTDFEPGFQFFVFVSFFLEIYRARVL